MVMTPKEMRSFLVKGGEVNIEALCTYLSALEDDNDELEEMVNNMHGLWSELNATLQKLESILNN